jgi:hypothetical protein
MEVITSFTSTKGEKVVGKCMQGSWNYEVMMRLKQRRARKKGLMVINVKNHDMRFSDLILHEERVEPVDSSLYPHSHPLYPSVHRTRLNPILTAGHSLGDALQVVILIFAKSRINHLHLYYLIPHAENRE